MTMDATFLEATKRVAHALRTGTSPRLKKRRRVVSAASVKALKEAGVSERDARILQEGHARELAFVEGETRFHMPEPSPALRHAFDILQEQTGSDVTDAGMIPGTGWTERADTPGTFAHAVHGTVHVQPGKWVHRDKSGTIRGSGANQESMTGYLRALGTGGNTAAADAASASGSDNAEALDTVLRRVRGQVPSAPAEAHRLVEAIRNRVGRTVPGDLHERLRKAATR